MILSYQDEQEIMPREPSDQSLATVGTVYQDGVTLIFGGSATESVKHYKANSSVTFAAGDRVYIVKVGGTYIVICKI